MAEHTPGPWLVDKYCDTMAVDSKGHFIAKILGATNKEMTANTRLIAAAPDLLAALEECRALMWADNPADGWADAITAADAALAKAKGETT